MQKIILYYKFTPVKNPAAVRLWQQAVCRQLNLQGRILISEHGINGTLGGEVKDLKSYIKETKTFVGFKGMVFKWSSGGRADFPRLSVKVRNEIVTFGVAKEIEVDDRGIIGGGKRLKPTELHRMVAERGDEVVFFDGRNAYEAAVGRFKNAVTPSVEHSRDFLRELDNPKYDKLKHRPVVTYCTGGIRCEVLSMLMKKRGFQEVYQLDGGIVKYGEKYGDSGLWEGSLYVFDGRMGSKFSAQAKDIGNCSHCSAKTSNYENCVNKACNKLILLCRACIKESSHCNTCQPQTAAV